eukprot:scaffold35885_cov65-Phaeocystis_antarctica.AAC.2
MVSHTTRLACYAIPRCPGPSHPDTKVRYTGDDDSHLSLSIYLSGIPQICPLLTPNAGYIRQLRAALAGGALRAARHGGVDPRAIGARCPCRIGRAQTRIRYSWGIGHRAHARANDAATASAIGAGGAFR